MELQTRGSDELSRNILGIADIKVVKLDLFDLCFGAKIKDKEVGVECMQRSELVEVG